MNRFCPYCGRKDHGFACAGLLGLPELPGVEPEQPAERTPPPGTEPVTRRKRPRKHRR